MLFLSNIHVTTIQLHVLFFIVHHMPEPTSHQYIAKICLQLSNCLLIYTLFNTPQQPSAAHTLKQMQTLSKGGIYQAVSEKFVFKVDVLQTWKTTDLVVCSQYSVSTY